MATVTPINSGRSALTAAAVRLDEAPGAELQRQLSRHEAWQTMVLGLYDEVPEVHYACTVMADALAKGRLFAGVQVEPGQPLIPVDDPDSGVPSNAAAVAQQVVAEFVSPIGGQEQIIRAAGINTMLAGEWYLVEVLDGNWAGWHVRGVEDVTTSGEVTKVKGLGEFAKSDVARAWQPHPRRFEAADSGMRACIAQGETVLLIDRAFRAGLRSRLFAGLLLLSNGFKTGPPDPTTQTAGDGEATDDPLVQDLVNALATAIQSEGTASAVVPNMLWGSLEDVKDGARLLSLAQQVDPILIDLRTSCLRRIANGLDIPAEVVIGMGDISHWGQWYVGEQFVQQLEPKAAFLRDAFTTVQFRPQMRARIPDIDPDLLARMGYGMDLSALMRRPNGDEDAKAAFERGELSPQGLRHALGLSEEFAPTDEETVRWLILQKAQFGQSLTTTLMRRDLTPDLPEVAPDAPIGGAPAMPAVEGEPDSPPAVPIAASGAGGALTMIDALLTERLFAAALVAFRRALEKAGHRAHRRVSAALRAGLTDVPPHEMFRTLGRAALTAAGVDDEELLAGALAALALDFDRWVSEAQSQALAAAVDMAEDDPDADDLAEFTAAQDQARDDAWEWFAAAALVVLRQAMAEGVEPREWEIRALVRQSLARAGGAEELAPVGDPTTIPTETAGAGLATGPLVLGLLAGLGTRVVAWEWVHGEPDHPFPPHVDQHGRVEPSEHDFDGWEPGDHEGCSCVLSPILAETGGTE